MAIAGFNNLEHIDGSYFATANMVAERGVGVVLVNPSGVTGVPGDHNNTVTTPSGVAGEVFVGVLFDDVVDWDRTTACFPHDRYRNATTACRPVNIVRQGDINTDQLADGATPTPGQDAYLTAGGLFTETSTSIGPVGKFRGVKQSNGFISIHIDQ